MINTKIVITLVLVGLFSLCKAYIACFDVFEGHRGFGNSTVLRLRTILEDLSLTLNMAKSGALANSSQENKYLNIRRYIGNLLD